MFYARLRAAVRADSQKAALVFVHGYNVSFSDAALRTAQIAADVGFPGPAIQLLLLRGELVGYVADQANARNSARYLARFLHDVATRTSATHIHVIAHSMGSEVVSRAAELLDRDGFDPAVRFDQIVLAAPDIDRRVFADDILPRLARHARGVTVYASSADRALQASKALSGCGASASGATASSCCPA